MKKSTFILIALLLVTSVTSIVLFRMWKGSDNEYQTLWTSHQKLLENGVDTLVIREVIRDTSAGTTTAMYNPLQTPGPVDGYVSKGVVDTMSKALGVATSEIVSLRSYIAKIEGKGKGERQRDTVTKIEWLVLKDDPTFDVKVNLNNDSIYPGVRLKLTQAYAPYRKNLFSSTEYRSVIHASDPRVKISNVIDVNRVPKSPKWSLGVFGGPLATPKGLTYGVGVGLTYDVIQF
ncbi:hypothetical protein HP439_11405 [Sphingobacterium shayense]|uniref:hypothetical protein n=1 Tax=Sphingobacterium shayense TaxID=626343 RepID=UPI001554A877|nr:hypothetical protein [Sphingobacterium shayense]NQD71327.1 hypothetical protein [Sphingobacterium shayense]